MEQRHTDAEFVILCKAHVLTRKVTVVGNTEMRQHHTLGETCRTTRVLHVADVVAGHLALHLEQCLVLHVLSQQQEFCSVEHAAIFLHTDKHHVLHVRETLTVQMAALTVLQFGQHRIGHIHVVTVPRTVGNTEGMHVGVLTQILQLILLVVRVHSHQHSTNLSRCIKERQPVWHIRSPDTDI